MTLRRYLPYVAASIVGAAIVTVVGFATESMAAVMLAGLGAGVVAGGIISAMQRKEKPRRGKRR